MFIHDLHHLVVRLGFVKVYDCQFHIVLISLLKKPSLELITQVISILVQPLLESLGVVFHWKVFYKDCEVRGCDVL